jgi:neurotransmitter:Na+ symporter, NSS family
MSEKRHSFGGQLGFVLAAAGSAVGLGNIWRFPYLAAKDGGGLFLVIYILLALTFGFALLTTEISIGRISKKGPLSAYKTLKKGWGFLGGFSCLVPMIILPYYCAIGGWVIKYMVVFMTGKAAEAATDDYFTGFITSTTSPIVYMLIFLIATSAVILLGVNKGIEKLSKYLMPALLILVIIISIFSLTLSHTDENGVTRTGLQGLKVLVVPNLEGLTFETLFNTIIDAIGQLFFSLSVAMGIMVAYGSYVDDKENISKSINQIEIFDTAIAILAGVMIIPAVYVFSGREGMEASGPSLLFVSLPKIFAQMGKIGTVVGCLFFIMVLFAALTSSISILEAVVSSFIDEFKMSRKTAVIVETIIAGVIAVFVCLGYNKFYFEIKLPNGSTAQLLDILDYVSNYLLMPLTAILTCILVGWVLKPKTILDEVTKNGEVLRRKGLYTVMIKFVAPIMLFILLLETSGLLNLFK